MNCRYFGLLVSVLIPGLCHSELLSTRTEHFEVLTTAGSGNGSQVATVLEAASQAFNSSHTVFESFTHQQLQQRDRIQVIQFGSASEYARFAANPESSAYFFSNQGHSYIVLSPSGSAPQVLIHEYVHYVARQAGLRLPVWLNEGLADYFSSLDGSSDSWEFGRPVRSRLNTIQRAGLLPLESVLQTIRSNREADETATSAVFYASSWALTHMLLTNARYAPQFPALLAELSHSETNTGKAFTKIYGLSAGELQLDLEAHVRHLLASHQIENSLHQLPQLKLESRPLSQEEEVSVKAELLAAQPWTTDRAHKIVSELAVSQPTQARWFELLGMLERSNAPQQAREHLTHAAELGSNNADVLYALFQLNQSAQKPAQEQICLLKQIVSLDKHQSEAAMNLAVLQFNTHEFEAALTTLDGILEIRTSWAHTYYCVKAYCSLKARRLKDARNWGNLARECATDATQKAESDKLLRQLEASGD